MKKVLRAWTFWIRSHLKEECGGYLDQFVLPELRRQPGNLRAAPLFRDLTDGTTQVVVASIWESMEHIRAYDGGSSAGPTLDPAIRAKILDRDTMVRHYVLDSIDDPALAMLAADELNAGPMGSTNA